MRSSIAAMRTLLPCIRLVAAPFLALTAVLASGLLIPPAGAYAQGPVASEDPVGFVRSQMEACNAYRRSLGEGPVFTGRERVRVVRAIRGGRNEGPRAHLVSIDRWRIVVDVRSRVIRSTHGEGHALPAPLDFCPPDVWHGPMHD